MTREPIAPRSDWEQRCKALGFDYFEFYGNPYWTENACYRFKMAEINRIEACANEVHQMCCDVAADLVKRGDYPHYGFGDVEKQMIERSWNEDHPYVYGRFDFGYDGEQLKLFEYNADTPTTLLEAGPVQWNWHLDHNLKDQFNNIDPALVERWKAIRGKFPIETQLYFTNMESSAKDDYPNVAYMMDTANRGGFETVKWLYCEHIGYAKVGDLGTLLDTTGMPIKTLFKLYPWEWIMQDEMRNTLLTLQTRLIEPAWKMLWSNKAILIHLWEKYRGHANLLPSYAAHDARFFDDAARVGKSSWVSKPLTGREGEGVTIYDTSGKVVQGVENNAVNSSSLVWQHYMNLPEFGGRKAILGVWMIGDDAQGLGVREDATAITTGITNSFVPHYID